MGKQQIAVMRNAYMLSDEREGRNSASEDRLGLDLVDNNDPERSSSHSEVDNGSNFDTVPYSRFSHNQKMLLVVQCAFTGFFSTVAGSIYYPVLTIIERKFNITEESANFTIVVYFIFQGLAPSIMGGLADTFGRRPVVLWAILTYFCACIGLACSHDYTQILALRCLQAAGISPVIATNSGIMGDVTTKVERGGYVGLVAGFQVVGTAFGALIGAGLSSKWGWRAIFWFLAIGSGICLVFSTLLLPETKRSLVGNGSVTPRSFLNRSLILHVDAVRKTLHLDEPDLDALEPRTKVDFLASLKILHIREIDILLSIAGLQFSTWTTHQTALTTVLSKKYKLSVSKIGLCFLPAGISTLTSIISAGRYLNWSYRTRKVEYNRWIKKQELQLMEQYKGDQNKVAESIHSNSHYTFNLVEARLHPAFVTLLFNSIGFTAFGWCISVKTPLAAVLCTSAFASLFSNCILTFSTTLIVDLFPSKASTATGCLNLFRCLLSAIFIAALTKMVEKMRYGGIFTFLSAINSSSSLLLFYLLKNGKQLSFDRIRANDKSAGRSVGKNSEKVPT
ncbi:CPA_1a_G0026350.mRNA.1.CDS.1 [Saccharomyces cerevisiae]|nr:CPA_1a_G0026350.mRNA.1.CDS.1 [Saccharomyces cerevisiae]CAI7237964.1 CPA_1a_G0026350.mRNA.1.CDS.1 [Saccharomyces cerevisiae]